MIKKYKKIIVIISAILLLIAGYFAFLQKPETAAADWWDDSWLYRKVIPVANNTTAESNVYVSATIDTSDTTKFQADCGDLRWTEYGGALLPYYIVSGCGTASTVVHINFASFPAGAQTIYYYYGNSSAENGFASADFSTVASNYTVGTIGAEEKGPGPVAYWKFDEGYGQTANDSTINANNGTLGSTVNVDANDPTWQTEDMCVTGKCLKFDGVDDYVDAGNGAGLRNSITGNYTIGLWIKSTTTNALKGIWQMRDTSGQIGAIFNYPSTGKIKFYSGGGSDADALNSVTSNLNNGLWRHIVFQLNGTTQSIYIDGVLDNSKTKVNGSQTNLNFYIGRLDTYYFSGSIDDVKIYPYARTAAQIKTDYASRGSSQGVSATLGKAPEEGSWMTNGLVGYWKMDEASWSGVAGEVLDASGAGNNGIAVGATGIPTTGAGKFGNGGVFDGVDDYVSVADNNSLDITNAITVSAWVKADVVFSSRLGEGYTVKYEADQLPENATPVWSKQGAEAATVSGGILTIVDTSTTSIRDYYRFWAMNRATGSTILTRVKVNSTSSCGLGFYVVDGTSWAFVCFDNNSTDLNDFGYISYPVDNTIFHSYRITFKSGLMKIFLDENPTPIINRSILKTNGNNVLQFGSSAYSSSVSTSDWDYLYYSLDGAYEPNDEQYLINSIASKGEDAYAFEIRSGMLYGFINNGSISTTIDTNWHYVTQTYDGSSHKLYVDGVLKSSRSLTGAIATNSSNLTFGNYLDGSIDEVRIYNRALSPKEVRDLYNFAPGPVGWWKMDDPSTGSGQVKADSSGYGNNGTTYSANGTGMDCKVPGKYGKGCSFDGVDDYVSVGNAASLNLGNAITVEAWIKPAINLSISDVIQYRIATKIGTYPNNGWYFLYSSSSDRFSFNTYDGSGHGATYAIIPTINTWYHVVGVSNGTENRVYVNGVSGTPVASGTLTNSTSALSISGSSANYTFNGTIDEVRIYNYARTASQIAEDYAAGAGRKQPIAHWKFDEGYGITANNSGFGGTTLNGTLANMASPATATSGWTNSGKFGKGLQFDGTDDVATVTNSTAIDLNDGLNTGFTISGWVNADTAGEGSGGQIFWKGANTYLRVDTLSGGRLDVEGKLDLATTDASLNIASAVATGAWNHIAMSYDGAAKITIWINGINKGSNTGSGATTAESNNLLVGGITTDNFDGAIDDFKIYSYELTEDEIREEYNSGVTTKLGSTGTSSSGVPDDSASRAYCIPGDTSTCNPPVGYWNFDEKTGTSANDISGNANTGTLGGGVEANRPSWISGKVGGGLGFDGSNDYVKIDSTIVSSPSSLTISSWIKKESGGSNYECVLHQGSDNTIGNSAYWMGVDSNDYLTATIGARTGVGWAAGQTTTLATYGKWYYLAAAWDGSVVRVYINGTYNKQYALATYSSLVTPTRIGASADGTNYQFSGSIDEVRIYNYARTPAQIAWDYNRGKPVAEWKFDECQGGTANDSSGNGNTGTITIGVTAPQTALGTCAGVNTANAWYNGRVGKNNSAMSFDGVNDYVAVANSASINTNYITVTGWMRSNVLGDFDLLADRDAGTTGNRHWGIGKRNTNILNIEVWNTANTVIEVQGTTTFIVNTWYYVAFTYDGTIIRAYLNGNQEKTGSLAGTLKTGTQPIYIGAQKGFYNNYLGGLIDEVRVSNTARTAGWITTEWNNQSSVGSFMTIGAEEDNTPTEFVSTIRASGGDYNTLSGWEDAVECDLTATTTRVFSGALTLGALSENNLVELYRGGVDQGIDAYVVATSAAGQILVDGITGVSYDLVAQTGDIWRKDASNYWTISGTTGNQLGDTAIAIAQIDGAWASADTTAVSIDGWTTSATNYIKIYTTTAARHNGKWDTGKYRISVTGTGVSVSEDFVWIDGLQVQINGTEYAYIGINVGNNNAGEIKISNNIIKKVGTPGSTNWGFFTYSSGNNTVFRIWNNIIYDFYGGTSAGGIYLRAGWPSKNYSYVYNNTLYHNSNGIVEGSPNEAVTTVKNNIVQDCADGFKGSFEAASNYNLSDLAGDAPGANSKNSTTVVFLDEANDDFHLAHSDSGARNSGTDLSADANLAFSDDIDGQTRGSSWDIGADETTQSTYRSVGPGATGALAVGTSNALTISGSTATFATGLPDNVGVGDGLQYDDDNDSDIDANDSIVFIHGRTSSTVYTVKTASGAIPTAVAGDTDWSLFRAYTSLALAETGTENTSIDADLRNFDTWSGGKDISSSTGSNEQWNIACYANETTADTSAVTISGWTTGANNYIKIYTTIEARHQGKWDTGKYRLELSNLYNGVINIAESYVWIDGLQINNTGSKADQSMGIRILVTGNTDIKISHNILKSTGTGTANQGCAGIYGIASTNTERIWNNIIYDYGVGIKFESYSTWSAYIYNNTLVDNIVYGIKTVGSSLSGGLQLKNNAVQGTAINYYLVDLISPVYTTNLSEDATSPNTALRSKVVTFVNETNDNFHLAHSDSNAKDAGADLSADAYLPFSDDIDGDTRRVPWDIGTDETYKATQANSPQTNLLTDGLVGYWSFNGANMDWSQTTAEARDLSGNANHGDVKNGATPIAGISGQGMSFDGVDDYVVTNNYDWADLSNFTISMWFNPNSIANHIGLISGSVSSKPLLIHYNINKLEFVLNNGIEICKHRTFNPPSAKQWHFITFQYDGLNCQASLNGSFLDTDALDYESLSSGGLKIGRGNPAYSDSWYNGIIDEVRIYNRALSADEVGQLYRAEARTMKIIPTKGFKTIIK